MLLPQIFKDRREAGHKLARILHHYTSTDAIVLALPRGGVITGAEIAHKLKLPLDIIVTRKISAPENEEYALGAIDVDGDGVWSTESSRTSHEWLDQEIKKEQHEAVRRLTTYRGTRAPLSLTNKIAIIVDDGIATGMTMKAAVRYAQKHGARQVVVAAPVAPSEVIHELSKEATVYTLETPQVFFAVGQFYKDFPQVTDKEVISTLEKYA